MRGSGLTQVLVTFSWMLAQLRETERRKEENEKASRTSHLGEPHPEVSARPEAWGLSIQESQPPKVTFLLISVIFLRERDSDWSVLSPLSLWLD